MPALAPLGPMAEGLLMRLGHRQGYDGLAGDWAYGLDSALAKQDSFNPSHGG